MSNQLKYSVYLVICMAITVLVACTDNEDKATSFDRGTILRNISSNIILPSYRDFNSKARRLMEVTDRFHNEPTLSQLQQLQEAWLDAKLSWKRVEIFNFGSISRKFLAGKVDSWPTSVSGIASAIEAFDDSDAFIATLGSNKKGLPAIEYLLFSEAEENILLQFQNSDVHKNYLKALASDLVTQSEIILADWEETQVAFNESTGTSATSSTTILANEMRFLVEEIAHLKVGVPSGIATSSDPIPGALEGVYSKMSKAMIVENLNAVRTIFTGGDGAGFDDYLNALDTETEGGSASALIQNQFTNCLKLASEIEGRLQEALVTEELAVKTFYEELKKLVILLEVDMMSQLNLIVTFSDADGD